MFTDWLSHWFMKTINYLMIEIEMVFFWNWNDLSLSYFTRMKMPSLFFHDSFIVWVWIIVSMYFTWLGLFFFRTSLASCRENHRLSLTDSFHSSSVSRLSTYKTNTRVLCPFSLFSNSPRYLPSWPASVKPCNDENKTTFYQPTFHASFFSRFSNGRDWWIVNFKRFYFSTRDDPASTSHRGD